MDNNGDTRTIASGQDARLIYIDQAGNKRYYLLEGDIPIEQYIDQICTYRKELTEIKETQQINQQEVKQLKEQQIDLGNYKIKVIEDKLSIYYKEKLLLEIDPNILYPVRFYNIKQSVK